MILTNVVTELFFFSFILSCKLHRALDMTDLEVVVEEATNGEPWGPHGKLLARIAKESAVSEENFREVMGVLIDRIQGGGG